MRHNVAFKAVRPTLYSSLISVQADLIEMTVGVMSLQIAAQGQAQAIAQANTKRDRWMKGTSSAQLERIDVFAIE